MGYVVAVDIGGTFTDCVVMDEQGHLTLGKAPSTPPEFAAGALGAIGDAALSLGLRNETELLRVTDLFLHACTVADNTLITRTGPVTGLLTTAGFADAVLMMRGKVTDGLTEVEANHASALRKPEPLVPRSLIGEIDERVDSRGLVITPLDRAAAETTMAVMAKQGVSSFAVSLLWCIANPAHERELGALLETCHPDAYCSLSSDIAPFLGEYERTITTVFNAYVGPVVSRYLRELERNLAARGLRGSPLVMQAYGGAVGVAAASRNAVGTIESGPAAGVLGTALLGSLAGEQDILATDMGGTTFKVGLVRGGAVERDHNPIFLRHRMLSSKVWVESIGAGGGSIAWIDAETGLLKVGPHGAGAIPGPVSYPGGGSEPTVTDADLVLGYLSPDYFLGGRITLDKAAATTAIESKLACPLGMSVTEAATAVYRITNAHLADLVRQVTVERGHDPRDFVIFAYGGAAPVHVSRYARELGARQVVIPASAAVQGAMGLATSDLLFQHGQSVHMVFPPDPQDIASRFHELSERVLEELQDAGVSRHDATLTYSVDMRYRFQSNELTLQLVKPATRFGEDQLAAIDAEFDRLYERVYGQGSAYPEAGKEIMALRVSASGRLTKPEVVRYPYPARSPQASPKARRLVYFEEAGDWVDTPVFDFASLQPGIELLGPAIVETPVTTMVVNPNDRASMDEFRNVRLTVGSPDATTGRR